MKKLLIIIICAAALLSLAACRTGALVDLDPEYKLMESRSLGTVYKYAGAPESASDQADLVVHSNKAVLIYVDEDRTDEEEGYYLVDTIISYYSVKKNDDGTLSLYLLKTKQKTDVVGDYPEEDKKESGFGVWEEYVADKDEISEEAGTVTLNESDKTFEMTWR